MKKICYVDEDGRFGGPQQRMLIVANELQNKGYTIDFLIPKDEIDIFNQKLIKNNLNFYQIIRYFLGSIIAYINLKFLDINVYGGDTQAGLKGFKKINGFNNMKFISKKFFFDLELIIIYSKKKLNIFSLKTNYSIPKKSSIKILNLNKNIEILYEWLKIIMIYK